VSSAVQPESFEAHFQAAAADTLGTLPAGKRLASSRGQGQGNGMRYCPSPLAGFAILSVSGLFGLGLTASGAGLIGPPPADAAEYFVAPDGDDTRAGTSRAASFASVQRGVEALAPGDILTIAPGEYRGSVKRADLGDLEHETVIRAEIPGTVTLRGDVPIAGFTPVAGRRFTYVADFKFDGPIPAVNEIDTLTILTRAPNADELDYQSGSFYHDAAAGKLYVASSDFRPAGEHSYSVSVAPATGLHLIRPKRVTVEGLAVTGFSAMELIHYREETAGGIWGMFFVHAKRCVVRDCTAYLNAWGIGFNSAAPTSGDNLVDRCTAYGNKSAFANGDMGGITVFAARRDVVRRSTAFRNGMYGINIYGTGGAPPNADDGGNAPAHKSRLVENLAWGNETADFKIKTGYEYHHTAERCVAPGLWSVTNVVRGTIGRSTSSSTDEVKKGENAVFAAEGFDPRAEFADPDSYDFRLQSDSRFRGKAAGGGDLGALDYQANIFYVRPDGDDGADGLSVQRAWKSLARAAGDLKPGATVYLEAGEYAAPAAIAAAGTVEAPVQILGRGMGEVRIAGDLSLKDCRHIRLRRLTFLGNAKLEGCGQVELAHNHFSGATGGVQAIDCDGLRIAHGAFSQTSQPALQLRQCRAVELFGNRFGNSASHAVQTADMADIRYADYNAYANVETAWSAGGKNRSLAELRPAHERQSRVMKAPQALPAGSPSAPAYLAGGPLGRSVGPHRDLPKRPELRLVAEPQIHSVTARTANLEWTTSLPATCRLAWGETPACEKSVAFDVRSFGTFSLTGLEPGKKYYFRITALETPANMLPKTEPLTTALDLPPVEFTTLQADTPPRTFYVATDGDDRNSGADRAHAFRNLRRAADEVKPGDTVIVAGGTYYERVRMRATGAPDAPITFRAVAGERVELNGQNMTLNTAFVAGGKSHLRFDGFYLKAYNLFPNDKWSLVNGGEFQLYHGKDIQITRCFSEGRGGYSAVPVAAYFVEDLLIKNCVNTYKFGGMYFWRCPNLRIENTVFAEPMINAFVLRNLADQPSLMRDCIFTDMLDKKARINLGVLCCDGHIDGFRQDNSCYYLRDVIPLAERALNGKSLISDLKAYLLRPVFADPLFAGDPGVKGRPGDKSGFSPDRMMDSTLPLDFDSFFADNPELQQRGIGLQPEAFDDFHFRRTPTP
jgi:hypothetical protein